MKTLSIKAKKRNDFGKKSTSKLRAENLVPCVMYGGKETVHFYAHENEFKSLIYSSHVYLVELDIEGSAYKTVLKDIQFHPVTDKINHIDFIEVSDDKPAVISLPIELTGTSAGVLAGGKIRQRRRYLKVKGLIKDMPELLTVDITNLNIGSVIKVSELSYTNLELLDQAQSMVVGVASSRVAAKGMDIPEGATSAETTEAEKAE